MLPKALLSGRGNVLYTVSRHARHSLFQTGHRSEHSNTGSRESALDNYCIHFRSVRVRVAYLQNHLLDAGCDVTMSRPPPSCISFSLYPLATLFYEL